MKTTVSEPSSWQRTIHVEIPAEEVGRQFDEKLEKYRKEIKLPGFRPGRVPRDIIRGRYGSAIHAEVVENLIQTSFQDACREKGVAPVSEPKLQDVQAKQGEPVSFSIEVEVEPDIDIKGYDKLKVKVAPKKIKSSDVDQALRDLRERMAELNDLDRPSKKGDLAMIEYLAVTVDGQPRGDFKNPTYPIEIGAGAFKEFDRELVGKQPGDEFEATVKFPKDHPNPELAGKTGEFKVKVAKVQEKIVPEVNEEFVKKLGDFADEQALRDHIRQDLERQERERVKKEAHEKAIDTLIKNNPFEVPPSRIKAYLDASYEDAQNYMRGQAPEKEEFDEQYRETAVKALKRMRIIADVAKKEKIKATQAEVDEEIRRIAGMYNQEFEQLKQAFRQNGATTRIRHDIQDRKTLDYLIGELEPGQD